MELEKAHPVIVQMATLVPPPPKGRDVQIRFDGQRVETSFDELGGFSFTVSGKTGDRVLVEVFVDRKLSGSEHEVLGPRPIDVHWKIPR